jgi:hypothetical protein
MDQIEIYMDETALISRPCGIGSLDRSPMRMAILNVVIRIPFPVMARIHVPRELHRELLMEI